MYDVYLSMKHTPLSLHYSSWLGKCLGSQGVAVHCGFNRVRIGDFPVDLAKQIQSSRNFIVVLTPETFGQPDDNTSWMAREIEVAVQSNANIIPIMTSDFIWPEILPPRVSSIQNTEGIVIEKSASYNTSPKNLDKVIATIMTRLLQTKRRETVFISYSTKDSCCAIQVRDMLEKHDIACWMAPDSIPAGRNYASVIPDAIEKCEIFLLILSKNSQASVWVETELGTAKNCHRTIIPFRIDNADITKEFAFYLINSQIIPAYKNLEDAYWDLRESIYDILSSKSVHP